MKLSKKCLKVCALILSLLLISALTACTNNVTPPASPPETPSAPAPEGAIIVFAAASLTDAATEIAEAFKSAQPSVTVEYSFASSGNLQTQIEEGAPADVFLSAAQRQMDALAEKGLIQADTRKDLLVNKVVLITPTGNPAGVRNFADMTSEMVKLIAIGDPASVPAGQYAQEVFTTLNVWDAVQAKANLGTDVRQVLTWVEESEVDCGVVYATDAATTAQAEIVAEAPAGSHTPIVYPAALTTGSENPAAARAYLDYLSGAEAAAIFEKYGFALAD
ncbi:MAG: molybdate ABC transporter substrate-binding protein [Gracilibacteraceae bacterium]|jgi:molybdate transport system substrate-binding protein|nr:molybdate ABC transporter substrate-binding protein [Gracilibacteraceae bacterium]